jgi:hypothetical protein
MRPERTTLAVVVVMTLGALPLALSSWALAPTLLVPLTALLWVLRARVVGTPATLEVCNGLRVLRTDWADVAGFQVPARGPVVLMLHGGRRVRLTAVSRRELPRLLEVSQPVAP